MKTTVADPVPSHIIYPSDGLRFQCAGLTVTMKSLSNETVNAGSVYEIQLPPHSERITPHLHQVTTEWFYILHGVCAFTLNNETAVARVGTCIFVPPEVSHTFWNPTAGATALLGVRSYPGMQHYLTEFTTLIAKAKSHEWPVDTLAASTTQLDRLLTAHDLFLVDVTVETMLRKGQCVL